MNFGQQLQNVIVHLKINLQTCDKNGESKLNFEFGAVQKFVNRVDLVKSFQTSICFLLAKSLSLQPRTGL